MANTLSGLAGKGRTRLLMQTCLYLRMGDFLFAASLSPLLEARLACPSGLSRLPSRGLVALAAKAGAISTAVIGVAAVIGVVDALLSSGARASGDAAAGDPVLGAPAVADRSTAAARRGQADIGRVAGVAAFALAIAHTTRQALTFDGHFIFATAGTAALAGVIDGDRAPVSQAGVRVILAVAATDTVEVSIAGFGNDHAGTRTVGAATIGRFRKITELTGGAGG